MGTDAICSFFESPHYNSSLLNRNCRELSKCGTELVRVRQFRVSRLWLNVNHLGAHNTWHSHTVDPVAYMSGVFTLSLPRGASATTFENSGVSRAVTPAAQEGDIFLF